MIRPRVAWIVAAAAAAAWLPFLTRPVSPDEGGFLLVASQWSPAHSLYGHYWVDRPPLLISLFGLAVHAGGALPLRLLGVSAVVLAVLLADRLTLRATGRRRALPVVVAGVFLSTPLFGSDLVNGELLAAPLVLAGVLALVEMLRAPGPRSYAWAAAAGVAATAAVLIKQNVVDVVVVAAALGLALLRRGERRRALALGAAFALGAGAALGACLVGAELRGTEPAMLWDAVVVFRGQAAEVIRTSASAATPLRAHKLFLAWVSSGAPLLLLLLALGLRRGRAPRPRPVLPTGAPDLAWPAAALIAWEAVAVAAGGSYWLHYLIGTVPGLVLLAVAYTQRNPARGVRRAVALVAALVVLGAGVSTTVAAVAVPTDTAHTEVAAYLRDHSAPGDTLVVAFGHPDIVWDSGLSSPYDELWSLPVRVRDPRLSDLTSVLRGPDAPTWVVVDGTSLATWGVDSDVAQRALTHRYRQVGEIAGYAVWRRDSSGVSTPSGLVGP